jgi:hypothetical protein
LASLLSSCEEAYCKRDGIISGVIDGLIILNPNEEALSGDKEDMVVIWRYEVSFSGSELAYLLE